MARMKTAAFTARPSFAIAFLPGRVPEPFPPAGHDHRIMKRIAQAKTFDPRKTASSRPPAKNSLVARMR